MKSLVSIIIPVSSQGGFIREAVDAALAQTYPNTEILVVGEEAAGHAKEVLTPYLREGKIRYVTASSGRASAWNKGIAAAKREFVALLESTDVFLPEKVAEQVKHLENNHAAEVSYCAPYHFAEDRPNEYFALRYRYFSGKEVFPNLLLKFFIAPSTVMARKDFLVRSGGFNEMLSGAEDMEFWLRTSYEGAHIEFLNAPLVKIRVCGEECARGMRHEPLAKLMALRSLESLKEKLSKEEWEKYQLSHLLFSFRLKVAFANLLVGRKRETRRYFLEAFYKHSLWRAFALLAWTPFAILPARWVSGLLRQIRRVRRTLVFRNA